MNADARAERFWWDDHADEIHVWGEEGDVNWHDGVDHCVAMLDRCLPPSSFVPGGGNGATLLLDLGCGMGRLAVPMAQRNLGYVLGVDSSAEMVAAAQRAARIADVDTAAFVLGDGRTLPYEARIAEVGGGVRYWFVWSVLLFQHIPPDAQRNYVEQVAKVLAPGGRYVVQIDRANGATISGGQFLHYKTHPSDFYVWADEFGLRVVSEHGDERYPQWRWITMEKP